MRKLALLTIIALLFMGAGCRIEKNIAMAENAEDAILGVGSLNITTYSETNYNGDMSLWYNRDRLGQRILTESAGYIDTVKFYMYKAGTPTPTTLNAYIYADGANPEAGTLLGTSDNVAVSSLPTSIGLVSFNFSTPVEVADDTAYFIVLKSNALGGTSADNVIKVGQDTSGDYNSIQYSIWDWNESWSATTGEELIFHVLGEATLGSGGGSSQTSDIIFF